VEGLDVVRPARIALIAVAAFALMPLSAPAQATTCTAANIAAGTCSVNGGTTGGGVDLWGDATSGGSGGSGGGSSDGPDECPEVVNGQCVGTSPPKDGSGPTSISDLESFRPRTPTQFVEPSGWSVRRIPTNFWTVVSAHTVSGELLGNPADVRFTPVLLRRYFGDGEKRTGATKGASWRDLGQAPWTRTSTGHAYDSEGRYRVRMLVWYSAAYRFGSQDWVPLTGEVAVWANELNLTVLSADLVLVDQSCGETSPGCPDDDA
jgi:hypothetical protein